MYRVIWLVVITATIMLICEAASAQDWDVAPTANLIGPVDGAGLDGIAGNDDDYDGTKNSPDLRGPDGIPGTDDDLEMYVSGTGSGNGGCFTNNVTNCAGATGSKSAEWSIVQVRIAKCLVESTLTNTSNGEPGCPGLGCINEWSSPDLENLQAAVRAALDIPPGGKVTAIDGPGGENCRVKQAPYSMHWNPDTPEAQVIDFEILDEVQKRERYE